MINDENLIKNRDYLVVKSNDLVRRARYQLSLSEQRAICYLCSLIKPVNDEIYQLEYQFSIRDYAKICGLDCEQGSFYEQTRTLFKGLRDKSFYFLRDDGVEVLLSWLSKVWLTKRSGIVKIRIDEDMIPFLFDLHKRFVSYGFINILRMKSQYSIRLYEFLKSYVYMGEKNVDLEYLKYLFMVEDRVSYSNYAKFKQSVLSPALEEIEDLTDLDVNFVEHRGGRGNKVLSITFFLKNKDFYYKNLVYSQKIK